MSVFITIDDLTASQRLKLKRVMELNEILTQRLDDETYALVRETQELSLDLVIEEYARRGLT